jgi:hypothetical protein
MFSDAYACPSCSGSSNNEGDKMSVYVLLAFIASTYIPFYLFYRIIKKNKDPGTSSN